MKRFDETLLITVAVVFGAWVIQSGVENVQKPDFLEHPPRDVVELKIKKSSPDAKLARFTENTIVCWSYATLLSVSKAIRQNDMKTLYRMEQT